MPKYISDATQQVLTVIHDDGSSVTFDLGKIPDAVKPAILFNGFKQKLADKIAGAAKQSAELGMSEIDFIKATMGKTYDNLLAGKWDSRGDGLESLSGFLTQAVMNLYKVDLPTASAKIQGFSKEERKNLERNPTVAAEMARLRAENLTKRAEAAKAKDTGELPEMFPAEEEAPTTTETEA